ncbi:MAG: ADP-ribosylglycohydrolase family protein [Actinobacteria bacterium]|jgi:ADP-ribosylglycohydrolase|nr:ADP-ribosylglycohydrolase family protein [Actinomycetota bacterium]NCW34675.1 ADP-ribosylglycohydrolase family protein [Actinomycetota bacterium]NCZ73164.1 ADP-ribosylglycohydrolase family protein [Actinomycetota bacterium]NDA41178.1 ADP-ribosylglycohydrolase family protein [Actinomycetota bacterium]NDB31056.1 ADP-ribosylglycohydrolase family protein [Actinomycetota bacterium]
MISELSRAQGAMAGLAIGDAIGRPVEGMSAEQIREKYGSVKDFVNLTPGGSDDTEYALLTGSAILKYGKSISASQFADFWIEKVCAQKGAFAGAGFSEMNAIHNLRKGLRPPFSGQHNHAWSDGLAMRVAPIGVVSKGNLDLAKSLAIADGEVSHAGEGIHSGVVIAVAISAAMGGASNVECFDLASKSIPTDSWTWRLLAIAREIVDESRERPVHEIADLLLKDIAIHEYFYADLAPEAVALAMAAVLYGDGDYARTLLFAVNLGRDADTIAAMAGAVAGAIAGYESIPSNWKGAVTTVGGTCLEFAKGLNPYEMAESLLKVASQ